MSNGKSLFFSLVFSTLLNLVNLGEANDSLTKSTNLNSTIIWEDSKKAFTYLYKASYLQWSRPESWITLGASSPLLIYSLEHDKRITRLLSKKKKIKLIDKSEHLAIASTFPLIPISFYFLGKNYESGHMVQFALENLSATYLALVESGLLSFIPIHRRPSSENLSSWETSFRGNSSLPSGHVIPFAVLTFKTFEHYGPKLGLIPAVITSLISYERIYNKKHYISDIVSAVILSALSSFGVSAAVAQDKESSHYQDFVVIPIRVDSSLGLKITYSY